MVPNGWTKRTVGEICRSIVPGRNKPKTFQGSIPWITTPEISGRYLPSTLQKNYIDEITIKECGGKIVPKNAVVMTAVGELGITAITTTNVVLNQQLHAFVCPDYLNHEYLAYYLSSQKQYMESIASKTTIPYMNKTNCESIPIIYPILNEQLKITKILSTWDKAITSTENLIANSEMQKKALMQQLLTGKKRLLDENGVRFSGEWKKAQLSQVMTIQMGSSPQSNNYNEQKIGLPLLQGNADIKNRKSAPRIYSSEITKECFVGDILLSVRAPVGSIALAQHHACIGRGLSALRVKADNSQSFFYHWLLWQEKKWIQFAQGSTFEAINSSDIKNLNIKIPSTGEQEKIAEVLSNANREIELLQAKLEHLKQEKKALMQQLLTGKHRVKGE